MSRSVLVLFILALGLGLYLWLVEMPMERKRAHIETESKQLVNFKDSDVQGFTLHSATGDVEVSRSDGDRADAWTITQPRRMEADRQAVDQFLRTLILAKVSRVVDDSGKKASVDIRLMSSSHWSGLNPIPTAVSRCRLAKAFHSSSGMPGHCHPRCTPSARETPESC